MKKMNKFVSMLLVVAMIFAMSISAFATGNGSATIAISFSGYTDSEYAVASGISVKQALQGLSTAIATTYEAGGVVFEGDYLTSLAGMSSEQIAASEQSDVEEILEDYIGSATTVTWNYMNYGNGYGTFTNHAVYNLVYAGYDWVYWIEKADGRIIQPDNILMGNYTIADGDTVVVNYDLYVTVFNSDPNSGERVYPTYP